MDGASESPARTVSAPGSLVPGSRVPFIELGRVMDSTMGVDRVHGRGMMGTWASFFRRALPCAAVPLAFAAFTGAATECHAQAIEPQPRIVVSGASGQIGGLVVEELLDRGIWPENLILVSRTPLELERYAALGASTRFGDFLQPESLDTAYQGGDRLLLISLNSNNRDPRDPARRAELHQVAIDAAVAAGVQHIVYTSFVDADNNVSPIAVAHRATETALRESGITWTILRNQWYADRLVGEAARMVADGGALVLPVDPGTAYVTREDCAVAVAVALMNEGHENRAYEITGPALVRMSELAAVASEISGVEIEVSVAGPADEVRDAPPSGGTLSTHFREITGEPGTTARDLLEVNRGALLAAQGGR